MGVVKWYCSGHTRRQQWGLGPCSKCCGWNVDFVGIVRSVFPGIPDGDATALLWEYTGFPGFWDGDPADCCLRQVRRLRDIGAKAIDAERDAQTERDMAAAS